MHTTTGRHSATTTIPQSAAEQVAKARAVHGYPIRFEGKRFEPGARALLTEQAREWRASLQAAIAAERLAQATS